MLTLSVSLLSASKGAASTRGVVVELLTVVDVGVVVVAAELSIENFKTLRVGRLLHPHGGGGAAEGTPGMIGPREIPHAALNPTCTGSSALSYEILC